MLGSPLVSARLSMTQINSCENVVKTNTAYQLTAILKEKTHLLTYPFLFPAYIAEHYPKIYGSVKLGHHLIL